MLALSAISWMIASLVPGPLFWTTLLDHLFVFWTTFLDRETTNFFLPSPGSDFFSQKRTKSDIFKRYAPYGTISADRGLRFPAMALFIS
jgi:hypothetical protein